MTAPVLGSARLLACFLEILGEVQARNLPIVELRPRSKSMEDVFSGDYDFVSTVEGLSAILPIFLTSCLKNGVHLEYNCDFRNKRVLRLTEQGQSISTEIWTRIELSGGGALEHYQEIESSELINALSSSSLPSRHEAILAAIYVTHVCHKKKNLKAELQRERMLHFREHLSSIPYGTGQADHAVEDLRGALDGMLSGDTSLPKANRAALDFLAGFGIVANDRRAYRFLHRRVRNAWLLSERIVPVLGPDGSGKSYFCQNVVLLNPVHFTHFTFKKLFRNTKDYWLLQKILRKTPKEPANIVDERMGTYIILKSLLFSIPLARNLRKTSRVAVMDRFFWDYLFRNLRATDNLPKRMTLFRPILAIIPRPRKCVVMLCNVACILDRKQELDEGRIRFIFAEYQHILELGYCRRVLFFNSERPFDPKVASDFLSST
jgi:hypothetical protein